MLISNSIRPNVIWTFYTVVYLYLLRVIVVPVDVKVIFIFIIKCRKNYKSYLKFGFIPYPKN